MTDALTLIEGESQVLKATVSPYNADNKRVIWSSSDISIADVSSLGTVQAIKEGKAKIKVITDDGAKTAECQVTVKAKVVKVESVNLNKNDLTMTEGYSGTLTATVYPSNATNKNVTWTSSDPSVATVNNGTVRAVKAGSATIKVTTDDGSKTAECEVTVDVVHVESIKLNKNTLVIEHGHKETLIANIYPTNAANKKISWFSYNSFVAKVDEDGTILAHYPGNSWVYVSTDDGGKYDKCYVTVIAKVASIRLNKSSLTITEGESETLIAEVYPDIATNQNVIWTSSDASIVNVNNGIVQALKPGRATVKATSEDGGKTAECQITVKRKDINGGHEGVVEKEW